MEKLFIIYHTKIERREINTETGRKKKLTHLKTVACGTKAEGTKKTRSENREEKKRIDCVVFSERSEDNIRNVLLTGKVPLLFETMKKVIYD